MDFSSLAKYIKSIPSKIHENDIAECNGLDAS